MDDNAPYGQQPTDPQNAYQQQTSPAGANVPLAVIGAAIGAAAGAAVWAAVEYFTHYQIGYIAVLVGAMAGWGATLLGRGKGPAIGVIAALLGGAGVFAGSYASYYLYMHGERFESDFREGASQALGRSNFSPEEEKLLQAGMAEARASITYMDYFKEDEKNMAFMALFGILGIVYGFKVGRGSSEQT